MLKTKRKVVHIHFLPDAQRQVGVERCKVVPRAQRLRRCCCCCEDLRRRKEQVRTRTSPVVLLKTVTLEHQREVVSHPFKVSL